MNFLALLGWNEGVEREIYSLDELKQRFDIARVNKSGARFDIDKLKWFNHHYIQQSSNSFFGQNAAKQAAQSKYF